MDKGTNKTQSVTITASSNLSDADIDAAVKEAEKYAEEDKKRKEAVEAKNEAEQLIFASEKFMKENGEKLTEDEKTKFCCRLPYFSRLAKHEHQQQVDCQHKLRKLVICLLG